MATTVEAGAVPEPDLGAHAGLLSRRYKTWLIAVLLLVSIFNFADRAILAVLAQPIKEDLKLTDTDLGILQGLGFAILYSVLGVPLGWLAERINRKGLIAACVAVWSLMTVACGYATGFVTLLLGRIGVGIGEAGVQPPMSSILADHFKANRRASVLAIVTLGSPLGFLVGQSAGGLIASEYGWRAAFIALGLPGLLCALLVWATLREPPRGLAEGHLVKGPAPSLMAVIRYALAKPTFRHLLIGSTVAGFTLNAVATFVLPFYLRGFGLPLAVAGALFGLVAFSSNGFGMLVGGFGFDALSRRDPRWSLWGPAAALALSAPAYLGAFVSRDAAVSMTFIWIANFVLISYFAPTAATMQNLVGPRMRASTSALTAMVGGLVGAGLGPTVVGMLSDFYGARAFAAGGDFHAMCPGGRAVPGAAEALDLACRTAATDGLRLALVSVLALFVWAAVHYLLASRTLRQDLYRPGEEGGTPA